MTTNAEKKKIAASFNKWLDDNHPTGEWIVYNFIRSLLNPLLTKEQDELLRKNLYLED